MNREDKLADALDNLTKSVGCLVNESRAQRALLHKMSAAMGLEIEDLKISDEAHGKQLLDHERKINQLALVRGGRSGPAE